MALTISWQDSGYYQILEGASIPAYCSEGMSSQLYYLSTSFPYAQGKYLTRVEVSIDDVLYKTFVNETTYSGSAPSVYLEGAVRIRPGAHHFDLVGYDESGVATNTLTRNFIATDTTTPWIDFYSPAGAWVENPPSGTAVGGSIRFGFSAADTSSLCQRVELWVDGTLVETQFRTSQDYTQAWYPVFTWNTTGLGVGTSHTLFARTYDDGGNYADTSTHTYTISSDTTPPVITWGNVAVPNADTSKTQWGKMPLAYSTWDSDFRGVFYYYVDGILAYKTTQYYDIFDTRSLSNGPHVFEIRIQDWAGNWGTSTPRTFTIDNTDTTPPVVTITSPAAGADVADSWTVNFTTSDNHGVEFVKVYFNETLHETWQVDDNWSVWYPPNYHSCWASEFPNTPGPNTITVEAIDWNGNTGSDSRIFNVPDDITPTNCVITANPSSTIVTRGTQITFTVTAQDNSGSISKYVFRRESNNHCGYGEFLVQEGPSSTWVWDTTSEYEGDTLTIDCVVYDAAFNVGYTNPLYITIKDTTLPEVTYDVSTPADYSKVTGVVTLKASVYDNVAVSTLRWYVDGVKVLDEYNYGATETTYSWDTTSLAQGSTHTFEAEVLDSSGNAKKAGVRHVTILDTVAPTISFDPITPVSGATATGPFQIKVNVSDNVGPITLFLVGGGDPIEVGSVLKSGSYTFEMDPLKMMPGTWGYYVMANDAESNFTQTESRLITIPPQGGTSISWRNETPADGGWTKAGTTTLWVALDGAYDLIQFIVDGVEYNPDRPNYVILSRAFADGDHTIDCRAQKGGIWYHAGGRTIHADNGLPSLSVVSGPATGSNIAPGPYTLAVGASDALSGLARIVFYESTFDPGTGNYLYTARQEGLGTSWDFDTTGRVGWNYYRVEAYDTAGNVTSETLSYNVSDVIPPTISWDASAPPNGASVTDMVVLKATAADDTGSVGIAFEIDGNRLPTTFGPNRTATQTWNTRTTTNGSHVVRVGAYDNYSWTWTENRTFVVSNTAGGGTSKLLTVGGFPNDDLGYAQPKVMTRDGQLYHSFTSSGAGKVIYQAVCDTTIQVAANSAVQADVRASVSSRFEFYSDIRVRVYQQKLVLSDTKVPIFTSEQTLGDFRAQVFAAQGFVLGDILADIYSSRCFVTDTREVVYLAVTTLGDVLVTVPGIKSATLVAVLRDCGITPVSLSGGVLPTTRKVSIESRED